MLARRIAALEANVRLVWTPDVRALVERVAIEEGIPAEKLITGVEELMRAVGPPYTVERMARHIAQTDGIPVEELLAAVNRSMEEDR
jgi:antitoxin component of RelBE/YafQ-DinJ toxin-antitoxin module